MTYPLPTKAIYQMERVPMYFELLNDTRNVFRLIFQNVPDPVQKFPGNLDDGLGLAHPFTILLKGHQKRRIFADGNPGGFNEQPSQLRMAPLRKASDIFFLPTCFSVWNQPHVTAQLIQRGETRDLPQFREQDHGGQGTDPGYRLQQTDKGPVLLRPGQTQDRPVQRGNQLAQMVQFLQMGLQGYIPTGSFHPNPLDPLDESSGPMTHLSFLRNHDSIKKQHPFDLVLTSGLLPYHALTGPGQGAILKRRSRRNVDALDLPIAKRPTQFSAIDPIPLGPSLFVLRRDVPRVRHETLDPFLPQLVVDPEATVTRFVYRAILTPRKVMSQVLDQLVHFRGLVECFVLATARKNTYTPALFVDIQTDINRLTSKIKSATLNMIHGKPPFGEFLCANKNHNRNRETCLFFFNSEVRKVCRRLFESYPYGDRERRDFSPAPSRGAGRPEGQNLGALVAPCG